MNANLDTQIEQAIKTILEDVESHPTATQIPTAKDTTCGYQGPGVDEPEAVRKAVRRSLVEQHQAQKAAAASAAFQAEADAIEFQQTNPAAFQFIVDQVAAGQFKPTEPKPTSYDFTADNPKDYEPQFSTPQKPSAAGQAAIARYEGKIKKENESKKRMMARKLIAKQR